MSNRVIWSPQPQQIAFQRRREYEVFFGGAAGGGKSDVLLAEGLRQVEIPHYRGIIFRKTFPQLSDLIDRSYEIYMRAFPKAKYNGTQHAWTFPSGAKIYFGNMDNVRGKYNYQGKHYDYIGFDELTQFSWDEYAYMMSRNRPNGPGTRVYLRATGNPGGIGHAWVKERFITPVPPMTTIKDRYEVVDPDGKVLSFTGERLFVPSSVFDNKALLGNDPNYLARLAALPEADKQALLYGSWDAFEGQVFTEWTNDPAHYQDRRWTHVIDPFDIPAHWKVYRTFDWGYSKPFAVLWYAVDTDGKMYFIREMYGWNGTPDHGAKWEPSQIAREIKRVESEDLLLKGKRINGVADPAIFQENGGESIAAIMEKERVYWRPGDHKRLPGKMQIHYRLAFDPEGRPLLQFFSACRNIIRTLPNLVYDDVDVEDVNTHQEDHLYDCVRYACMDHITPARKAYTKSPVYDDPLDLNTD